MATLEEKISQYNEFFTIEDRFIVNIIPLEDKVPEYQEFIDNVPMPFQIASEVATLDQSALRPLRQLDNVTASLVDFLNLQSKKINLLVNYILAHHDSAEFRHQGVEFGGGGLIYCCDQAPALGDFVEIKLFFEEDHSAVYAIGEVVELIDGAQQQVKLVFHHIRDEDRELVVRASLHRQSKQLHALAQKRRQQQEPQD
jgi:hypothetical protein